MPRTCTILLLATVAAGAAPAAADSGVQSLAWLAGCWAADGGEPGSGEFWTPPAGDSLFGVSRTIREGRTVAYEFLRIGPGADGGVALTALPSGQAETHFRLVSADEGRAVFENPQHDFPQRIVYAQDGADRLDAWIEGDVASETRRIDFPMTRTACESTATAHREPETP